MGKMESDNIRIEADNTKRLPGTFGIEDFAKDVISNDTEDISWQPIDIKHTHTNGRVEKIELRIGKNIDAKFKRELTKLFSQYSEVFSTDQNYFPCLLDDSGKPILHSLGIRSDAVIKNSPVAIKLPPEKNKALEKLIAEKLKNKVFTRIARDESAYCTPVDSVTNCSSLW